MMVPSWSTGGLRSIFKWTNSDRWTRAPIFDKTRINLDLARQLYRNDGEEVFLGGGFCRPIIDRCVEFIGMPTVSIEDEERDNELNDSIQKVWKPVLQEMYRNAMRDSKTVVRMWQPEMTPLVTQEERESCCISIIDPERATIVYDPRDPKVVERAVIVYTVDFPDDAVDVSKTGDPPRGQKPQTKEHEIWEVITASSYRYYDKTDAVWLADWARDNPYDFVPVHEVWNEYDSTLSGGQSDYEAVYPLIRAFHEVLLQALKSHKYHSAPKIKLAVADIPSFLRNNFPTTVDEEGQVIPGGTIRWEGREVLITAADDDIEYIEVKSVLGDSKTLLEFLIDCISVAAEMPEEFFMRTEAGGAASAAGNARFLAFEKKIERKRNAFQADIQMLIKMHQVINNRRPQLAKVFWEEIRPEALVDMAQALQQTVMALEVLLQRKLVSENTSREMLRSIFGRFFRRMKGPSQEAADAEGNLDIDAELAKLTAAFSKNGNGSGDKKPAISGQNGGGANE
jgi:hypothetical protein